MDIVPIDLTAAARAARDRLSTLSRDVATANAGRGAATPGSGMPEAAGTAIFADALLAAVHARLQELKNAARA